MSLTKASTDVWRKPWALLHGSVPTSLVLAGALAGGAAVAQEGAVDTAAAPADTLVAKVEETDLDRAETKLELLAISRQQIEELIEASQRAEGEERELKRIEAMRIVDDMTELSGDIVKLLPKLEATPAAADSVREVAGGHLQYQAELYSEAARRVTLRLADLRRRRGSVALQELGAFEAQVAEDRNRVDALLELACGAIERIGEIGLDPSELANELDGVLVERAETLATRLQLAVAERDRMRRQVESAKRVGADDELPSVRIHLQVVEQQVDGLVGNLDNTVDILGRRGIETAEYRKLIILATGELTEDILDIKVLVGVGKDILDAFASWFRENGPTLLFRVGVLVLFIILFRLSARITWFLARLVSRPPKLLGNMIGRMLPGTAGVVGFLAGLWFLGVDPTTLLAGVGVASVIIGLALQDSLGNLAAGVFILVYRPYDEDDVVQAGGVIGRVRQMGLANTMIVTFDNRRLFVPNRKIWSDVIENRSAERMRRVDTTVRISYQEDIERALRVIRETLDEHELVLENPEPSVFVSKLDDSWVEIAVWPWASSENWWALTTDLPKAVREGLERGGVEIPYPRAEITVAERQASHGDGRVATGPNEAEFDRVAGEPSASDPE